VLELDKQLKELRILYFYSFFMANKLFVGNIPYSATEDTLRAHFAQHGEVTSVNIIKDRDSGRSKGFGFVEFATDEDAMKALKATDGQDFEDRPLAVKEARPQEERPRRNDYNNSNSY
jgi:RNA recognition motif-containing protein